MSNRALFERLAPAPVLAAVLLLATVAAGQSDLEKRVDDLVKVVEAQNAKIEGLENTVSELRGQLGVGPTQLASEALHGQILDLAVIEPHRHPSRRHRRAGRR